MCDLRVMLGRAMRNDAVNQKRELLNGVKLKIR